MAASTQSWLGRPCPKCAYARTVSDNNPAWQCPKCQVVYAKARPARTAVSRLAADGREIAAEAKSDGSLAALVAANILALAIAWMTGMSLRDLMIVYWIQSVVIGITSVLRILSLRRFAGPVGKDGRRVEGTAGGAKAAAAFFAMHYGLFHFGYLMFLTAFSARQPGAGTTGSMAGYGLCALVFMLNHGYSLMRNIRRDAAGKPNIGTIMFLPYARILPMHLTIILGAHVLAGALNYFVFGFLKIVADMIMHSVEHHVLAKSGTGSDSVPEKSVSGTDSPQRQ